MDDHSFVALLCLALPLVRPALALDGAAAGAGSCARARFVDLGSGIGRTGLLAAALFGGVFAECIGIELLPGLHAANAAALREVQSLAQPLDSGAGVSASASTRVHALCDDFLSPTQPLLLPGAPASARAAAVSVGDAKSSPAVAPAKPPVDGADAEATASVSAAPGAGGAAYEWWAGDTAAPAPVPAVVFCNATCFDADFMSRIEQRAALLPAGSVVITTTHALPGSAAAAADVHVPAVARVAAGATARWRVTHAIPNVSRFRSTAFVHVRM